MGGDGGDDAVQLLAEELLHILGLVAVLAVPFDAHGADLLLAGPVRRLDDEVPEALLDVLPAHPGEVGGHDTVDQQVGIPADRRGEVGVLVDDQAEVADVLGGVEGLGHHPQDAVVDDELVLGAPGLVENVLQGHLGDALFQLGDVKADLRHALLKDLHLVRRGLVVDTEEEGQLVLDAEGGRGGIGQQHKLLNHIFAETAVPGQNIHRHTVLVEDDLRLAALQVQAASGVPVADELFIEGAHLHQCGQHPVVLFADGLVGAAVKEGVDLAVYALDRRTDQRLFKAVGDQAALVVQLHQRRKGQAVLPLVEGADAVGELLGQHRDHRAGVVDGGAALIGVPVDGASLGDIVAHIGDVDAELIAGLGAGQGDGVVDVLGVRRVDGKDDPVPQVQPLGLLLLVDAGPVDGGCLGQALGGELHRGAGGGNDGGGTVFGQLGAAEVIQDPGLVVKVAQAAADQLAADLVALLGLEALALGDADGKAGPLVRHNVEEAAVALYHAGEDEVRLLEDTHHFPFGAAVPVLSQAQQHHVAGHGAHHPAAGNEHILLRLVRVSEAKGGVDLDDGGPDLLVRRSGQGEALLLFPQLPFGEHAGDDAVELRPVLPAQMHRLADVLAGGAASQLPQGGLYLGFEVGVGLLVWLKIGHTLL